MPGVGPAAAITFLAAVDDPHRFARSKDARRAFWPHAETRTVGHLDRPRWPYRDAAMASSAPRSTRRRAR
ncbi:transposase [Mesorhizobium sp. M0633]|uniref:transposase n=1 Tax=Mesorhizobium sp. M0633 TaxID=2956977 RepID=UPI00333937FD